MVNGFRGASTRAKFVHAAVLAAEREMRIPRGWWGVYRDVRGPSGQRAYYGVSSGTRCWIVSHNGKRVSAHDSRRSAIRKAAKL
jgi:hypothetical protein